MILVVADQPELLLALRDAGLRPRTMRPVDALGNLGFAVGADVIVMGCTPGTHPLVESEAFQTATVLYVHADEQRGTVGPVAIAGASPCPTCLAGTPSDEIRDGIALQWAAASAAMEVHTLATGQVSTLLGIALTWSLDDEPGLKARAIPRLDGCLTQGCAAAR